MHYYTIKALADAHIDDLRRAVGRAQYLQALRDASRHEQAATDAVTIRRRSRPSRQGWAMLRGSRRETRLVGPGNRDFGDDAGFIQKLPPGLTRSDPPAVRPMIPGD